MSYTTFALGDKEGLQFIYFHFIYLFIYLFIYIFFEIWKTRDSWSLRYIHSIGERNNESIENLEDLLGDTTLEIRGH